MTKSTIAVGSCVQLKNHSGIGQVVSISVDRKVLVPVGILHFYLPLHAIQAVESPWPINTTATKKTSSKMVPSLKKTDPVLDLHGLNKRQALFTLENFLDRSLLLGYTRLKIIHGQGMDILRNAIRKYLKNHPLVKELVVESPVHCMAGMTIVEI